MKKNYKRNEKNCRQLTEKVTIYSLGPSRIKMSFWSVQLSPKILLLKFLTTIFQPKAKINIFFPSEKKNKTSALETL